MGVHDKYGIGLSPACTVSLMHRISPECQRKHRTLLIPMCGRHLHANVTSVVYTNPPSPVHLAHVRSSTLNCCRAVGDIWWIYWNWRPLVASDICTDLGEQGSTTFTNALHFASSVVWWVSDFIRRSSFWSASTSQRHCHRSIIHGHTAVVVPPVPVRQSFI